MLSYSPFQTINNAISYPSTLIITEPSVKRVSSYHSYKFAGKLQNGLNQKNPILQWVKKVKAILVKVRRIVQLKNGRLCILFYLED
jgi:protease II